MAEQTALPDAQAYLDSLIDRVSDWDRALVEQAVHFFGLARECFSCNSFRYLLPKMAHGHVGIVVRSMAQRRLIVQVRDRNGYPVTVTSTAESTHGKPIAVYKLTPAGERAANALLGEVAA